MEVDRKVRERQTPPSVGLHQDTPRGGRIPPKVLSFFLIQISPQLGLVTRRIFQLYNIAKLWREFRYFSKIQTSDFWFPGWSNAEQAFWPCYFMLYVEGCLLEGEVVCVFLYDVFLIEATVQISAAVLVLQIVFGWKMFSQAPDWFHKLFGCVWEDCTLDTTREISLFIFRGLWKRIAKRVPGRAR